MLQVRMRELPRRYQHSLGVARTAVELARAYGVDEYHAALAGLVHDWDKVLDDHELLARAAQYGVRVSGSPTLAAGLLHGPVAAHELPHIFEGISAEVCQAVARHTVGACDMTPLDMVVFTADAIEPGRRGDSPSAFGSWWGGSPWRSCSSKPSPRASSTRIRAGATCTPRRLTSIMRTRRAERAPDLEKGFPCPI